jgi:hypothetical protein
MIGRLAPRAMRRGDRARNERLAVGPAGVLVLTASAVLWAVIVASLALI